MTWVQRMTSVIQNRPLTNLPAERGEDKEET
jgi:hypothetical protein